MPLVNGGAQTWLERAQKGRTVAREFRDEEARKYMLAVAEGCERIAKLVVKQLQVRS
jgi:hypothetical protein